MFPHERRVLIVGITSNPMQKLHLMLLPCLLGDKFPVAHNLNQVLSPKSS